MNDVFEPDDPMTFTAVAYPVEDREEADREMARCFIEEYALMGWSPERIRGLFRSGAFAGTHAILERRGEPFVEALLAQTFGDPSPAPEGTRADGGGVGP